MQKQLLVLGTLAALASAFSLQAQCAEGSFGTAIGTGDDTVLGIQSLGFAFPFNGTTFTDVHVSTNGFVYLSNGGVPAPGGALCCAGSTAQLVAGSPKIAAYWSDLNVIAGTGNVKFNALPGKAVITWENAVEFGNTSQFTVQMQLSVTGEITFTYDSRCQIRTAGDFLVGMSEGGGAVVPAASDFAASSSSTTNTNFELFTALGSFDLAGQSVLFVPTAPGYVWIPSACPKGANTNYGSGCYNLTNSFYQLTTTPAVSSTTLSNTGITLIPTGSGAYTIIPGGTFTAPTGAATPLTLTDDSQVTTPSLTTPFPYAGGTASTFTVCSNGSVWVATGNSIAYAPAVGTMLGNPQTGWYAWHDYNPGAAGSGQVKFEEVGTTTYITWDGVFNYGGTTVADANQVQFQFDSATGIVVIAFGTVSAAAHTGFVTGEPHLVGYSPGGASVDPGSMTFATDLPFTTSALDQLAMQLSASPAPVSSATSGSTVVYTTTNINEFAPGAGIYIGINVLSIGQLNPGVDLFFLGAPGCRAYIASLDVLQNMVGVTPTGTASLPLPAGLPSGLSVFSQSIALIAPNSLPNGQNAFGMTVSNGVESKIGSW